LVLGEALRETFIFLCFTKKAEEFREAPRLKPVVLAKVALLKTTGFRGGASRNLFFFLRFTKKTEKWRFPEAPRLKPVVLSKTTFVKTTGFRRGAAKPILDDFQGLRRRAVKEFQTAIYKSFRLQFNKKKPKMEVSRSASPKTSGFKQGCLA